MSYITTSHLNIVISARVHNPLNFRYKKTSKLAGLFIS